jgi:xanthine dehydrogenase accessory factor
MEASLGPLLPLFTRERSAGRALALGILVQTDGSTYRKPGALILIAGNGDYAGLISGGCLEGDLREHAHEVIRSGDGRSVRYDLRDSEDLLWGLGLGCEGAMQILLLRVDESNAWQPLTHLAAALAAHRATAVGIVVESQDSHLPVGAVLLPAQIPAALPRGDIESALERSASRAEAQWLEMRDARLFLVPLSLPPRVLLLGAGPDAVPVVDLAVRLGWKMSLADHRAAYAVPAHFPSAERVVLVRPETLPGQLELTDYAGAVVMSHHLPSDLAYLRTLAESPIPYIGLLGPAVRRERLLEGLGPLRAALAGRLHAPVGLPLGGRTPESIALAIVAELHAFVHAGPAGPFGGRGRRRDLMI